MDKELIERCVLAAMKEVATSGQMGPASKEELAAIDRMSEANKALTVSLFSAFVRHFDAERGKNAVTHQFQRTDGTWSGFIDQRHYEATVASGDWPIRALFLSPTIPKGMALVKKAVLRDRGFVYIPGNVSGAAIPIVTVQFDLNDWDSRDAFAGEMIAAQGERHE